MSAKFIANPSETAKNFCAHIYRDTKGTASIEFILITPILLIFMMGTMEVSRAINIDKRVNTATSMAGDLISQEDDLNGTPTVTLDAIMDVVAHVMHPYDENDLKLTAFPIKACLDDETQVFVYADPYNYNGGVGGAPAKDAPYSLPSGVMTKNSMAIVVKAEFDYTPLMVNFMDGFSFLGTMPNTDITWDDSGNTFTDEAIHTPRKGCVDFNGNDPSCAAVPPGC